MDIKIQDYLSYDEQKEICKKSFEAICIQRFIDDADQIILKSACKFVAAIINETFEKNARQIIEEKTKEVINNLSMSTVFQPYTEGHAVLQKAIRDNAGMIDQKIKEVIANIDKNEFEKIIKDRAIDRLIQNLFGGNKP